MRIKTLRLRNGYKRFHDLTINLGETPARIVALVGPNGCGKSSVLDGLIFHVSAWGQLGNTAQKDYNYHSMEGKPGFDYKNVEIELVEGEFGQVRMQRGEASKTTMISFRSPYRFNSSVKIIETRSTNDIRHNTDGASDASSLDEKMEENYRRILGMVGRYRDDNDIKPSEAVAKILGDLNTSIERCLDLKISGIGNVEANKGTLYFTKLGHPNEFEFNVLSSGEKEVVDILLDLYLRSEDFDDTIFLFDEPELHINTAIQGKLLLEIDRLVGENCQIWITTHSVGFLRALQTSLKDKCQVLYFDPALNLASSPATLEPMRRSAAAWRNLFAVALDDLASLVSPKTIVYCEGRAEPTASGGERGMDAQAYNLIFAEAYPEVLFVSSGGNTELDQRSTIAIAILGKVFPTVSIWLLKDRDMASGKKTDEADRQSYLSTEPPFHRVLKRWEIENYLYDKEVLKAYCAAKGKTFNEAAYDTLVTNVGDQNLKDITGQIKTICSVTESISADRFKLALAETITSTMDVYAELESCIFHRQ